MFSHELTLNLSHLVKAQTPEQKMTFSEQMFATTACNTDEKDEDDTYEDSSNKEDILGFEQ